MHIKGYTVELLVNDNPLKEYVIPTTDLEVYIKKKMSMNDIIELMINLVSSF